MNSKVDSVFEQKAPSSPKTEFRKLIREGYKTPILYSNEQSHWT